MLFTGKGSVRMVRNCDLGLENAVTSQKLLNSLLHSCLLKTIIPSTFERYSLFPKEDRENASSVFILRGSFSLEAGRVS